MSYISSVSFGYIYAKRGDFEDTVDYESIWRGIPGTGLAVADRPLAGRCVEWETNPVPDGMGSSRRPALSGVSRPLPEQFNTARGPIRITSVQKPQSRCYLEFDLGRSLSASEKKAARAGFQAVVFSLVKREIIFSRDYTSLPELAVKQSEDGNTITFDVTARAGEYIEMLENLTGQVRFQFSDTRSPVSTAQVHVDLKGSSMWATLKLRSALALGRSEFREQAERLLGKVLLPGGGRFP